MTRLPRSGRQSLGIHRESCQRHRQALLPPASIGTAAEQQGLGTGVRLRRRGGELRGRGRRGLATGARFRRRGRRCGGPRALVVGGGRGADGHLRRFRVRPARAGGAATSTATRQLLRLATCAPALDELHIHSWGLCLGFVAEVVAVVREHPRLCRFRLWSGPWTSERSQPSPPLCRVFRSDGIQGSSVLLTCSRWYPSQPGVMHLLSADQVKGSELLNHSDMCSD